MFVKIFQVSADERMGIQSKLDEFTIQELFQIRTFVISTRKAKHLNVTTMFTCFQANTPIRYFRKLI